MNRSNIKTSFCLLVATLGLLITPRMGFAQAPGDKAYISPNNGKGYFPLAVKGKVVPIYTAGTDYPGVMIAVKSLQADIKKVTADSALLLTGKIAQTKNLILIGTLGKNEFIDGLSAKKS